MPRADAVRPLEERWRRELFEAFTTVEALAGFLRLPVVPRPPSQGPLPVRVPRSFAARMVPGDPDDPLLRQVLPSPREREPAPGYRADPVGDRRAEVVPGLLQKYRSRALALISTACSVYCRFCFRQHTLAEGEGDTDAVLAALRRMRDIDEVILSGGDPLMLGDRALRRVLAAINDMAHVRRVRFHTRMATALPSRITPSLIDLLARSRQQVLVVLHVNHPNELTPETAAALGRLRAAGIPLLNQSVLLRGVNDRCETLADLSEKLVAQGAMPYYLHQLDRARGTHRFEVPEAEGLGILEAMRAACPGYMVPRYVREIEGEPSKTPVEATPTRT